MRILVSADIHLGSPIRSVALRNPELGERLKQGCRDTFSDLVSLALEESVDAVALAGDIFDNDSPDIRSRTFLIKQLTRLADAGIQTFMIRGNHDALLDHQDIGNLGDNIHLLNKKNPTVVIGNTAFHGLSFDKTHEKKSFLPDFPGPVAGKHNVGLMHTSLDGSQGHDPYAPCAVSDLMAHGFDLWCLGHIHAPFEHQDKSALVVMPGIPQPRHFGERKGGAVVIVSLGDGQPVLERHEISRLGFVECQIDLSECSDQQELIRSLQDALSGVADSQRATAVRLSVISDQFTTSGLTELAEELLETIDDVFLDKVKVKPSPQRSNPASDDLVRLMKEELSEEGFRQLALNELEILRAALPSDVKDELGADELDALLEEAVAEVALNMHTGASR